MKKIFMLFLIIIFNTICAQEKIVGLVPVRNEEAIIKNCLKVLSLYTDAIVVYDDFSEDSTIEIIESLKEELKIETIVKNSFSQWEKGNEINIRQRLLDEGRKLGGTHFIQIDADEIISANCLKDNWLRNEIFKLKKGEILCLPLVHPWKSLDYYRNEIHGRWTPYNCMCSFIWHDDGTNMDDNKYVSEPGFIHIGRFPHFRKTNLPHKYLDQKTYEHSLIHMRFVDWDYIETKRAWYMCLETIRSVENISIKGKRTKKAINEFYTTQETFNEKNMLLEKMDSKWLDYSFLDKACYMTQGKWRKEMINRWFNEYGPEYFADLNLWSY